MQQVQVRKERIDVTGLVRTTVESTLGMRAGQLDVDAELESFGVDSIIAMELLAKLSKEFSVSITPAQFMQFKTLRELSSFIDSGGVRPEPPPPPSPVAVESPAPRPGTDRLQPEPKIRAAVVRTIGRRGRQGTAATSASVIDEELLSYIRQKYGVELARRQYKSIDELVEVLVADHHEELLQQLHPHGNSELAIARGNTVTASEQTPAQRSDDDQVAIVGMSCRFPDAADTQTFWRNLMERRSSLREIPRSRWNWEEYYSATSAAGRTVSKWGGLVDAVDCFDAAFFGVAAADARLMDPQERLLCQEVYRGLEDAGLDVGRLSGSSTGVFIGYEYSEYEQRLRSQPQDDADVPRFSSSSPGYYLANRLSYLFDFCGPSEAINLNCASSAVAINRACQSIAAGESTVAIAAGVSLNLFAGDYIAATQHHLLSPDGTCGVFDDNANGFTRGEGVGVVILKPLRAAQRDRNRIYGVIRASHQNNRGRAASLSEIKHEAITQVIGKCYEKAGIQPETVSYIELDGYCTKWGDSFEFEGIKNAFRNIPQGHGKLCGLGSAKGNIGHLEPASGVASLIKVALSMYHKQFPPTLAPVKLNEFIDLETKAHPLYLADQGIAFSAIRQGKSPVRAGINSFADSGSNVHILVEEYLPGASEVATAAPQRQELFVLSARDPARLEEQLQQLADWLAGEAANLSFQDVVFTSQTGRRALELRLAIQASSLAELLQKVAIVRSAARHRWGSLDAHGIYYGELRNALRNPLVELMGDETIARQLDHAFRTEQWRQVALLWVNDVRIPWERLWEGRAGSVVSLPGYPFARDRHWIEAAADEAANETQISLQIEELDEPVAHEQPVRVSRQWVFALESQESAAGIPLAPREKMQLFLKEELALQLNQMAASIATDQNYMELGINSLGVIGLCRKVNQLLQIKLSPSIFIQQYDIDKLSTYLVEQFGELIERVSVLAVPGVSLYLEGESLEDEEQIPAEILWREEDVNDGTYEKLTF